MELTSTRMSTFDGVLTDVCTIMPLLVSMETILPRLVRRNVWIGILLLMPRILGDFVLIRALGLLLTSIIATIRLEFVWLVRVAVGLSTIVHPAVMNRPTLLTI